MTVLGIDLGTANSAIAVRSPECLMAQTFIATPQLRSSFQGCERTAQSLT